MFAILTLICSLQNPVFAHNDGDHEGDYAEHIEEGVKLPFDSIYCDLNENQKIENSLFLQGCFKRKVAEKSLER